MLAIQKTIRNTGNTFVLCILSFLLLLFWNTDRLSAQSTLIADDAFHRVDANGSYQEFLIPNDLIGTYKVNFRLLGGDGGGAKTPGYECEAYGGDGAYVTITFNIGTGSNDLQPGGKLRFISGKGGWSAQGILTGRGSGGGGSGLLYTTASAPSEGTASTNIADASSKWVILGVAGGGGGAYRAEVIVCYGAANGQGGRASTSGGNGIGAGGTGGTNGNGGSGDDDGLGGAGVFGAGSSNSSGYYTEKGGTKGSNTYTTSDYGFGYGGGGAIAEFGGGGGGYSGGGGAGSLNAGGGGGSFANNAAVASSKTDGGSTEYTTDDGYIEYQITQEGAPVAICNDFLAVNLSIYDTEIGVTADDIDNGSYDLGSGTISLSIDNSDCTTLDLGSNLVTLTVTDNDGNISTCQTHVVVLDQANSATEITSSASYTTQSYTGSYKDFKIPYSASFDEICFNLNGGDGGYASVGTFSICPDCKSRGGYGARTQVCFNIGCGDDELEPGSILRFIIGGKGNSNDATEVACNGYGSGGGGGGTGLLYKEYGCNDWVILAAAGGGGGAFQGQTGGFCTNSNAGGDGQTNVNGDASAGSGGSDNGNGGTDGRGGWFGADAGAGGGYSSQGGEFTCGFDGSIGAGKKGYPSGGAGGNNQGTGCTGRNGGFGFGGGGMAWDVGAGGGGYSGGGAGGSAGGGGGGGSYINQNYATTYSITTEAYSGNPADGYIQYRLFGGSSYNNGTVSASCKNTYTVELGPDGTAMLFPNQLDNGSSLECDANGLYAQFIPNSSALELDCNDVGTQTMTVGFYPQASEASSNSCSTQVTVTENTAPTAICQDITLNLNNSGTASIIPSQLNGGSSDNCSIAAYTASATDFNCENIGTNQVTLTVTDAAGNNSTCIAYVSVQEASPIAPTAKCKNTTVALDAATNTATITFVDIDDNSTDNCAVTNYSLDQTTFDCDDLGDNTVILTVEDDGGLTSTCTAMVTVEDQEAPVAKCQDLSLDLNGSSGILNLNAVDVNDGSTDNCPGGIASYSLSQTQFDCSDVNTPITVTLTVTDQGGNSSTCNASIVINDITAPLAQCQNLTISLDASGNATITPNQVDNGSSDACGITNLSLDQTTFDCDDIGSTKTVTLTATDGSGNASTCTAFITVQDESGPDLICHDINIQLDINGDVSLSSSQISTELMDACGIANESFSQSNFDCSDIGTNVVTLTTTDVNGNASSCTVVVTVEDHIAPNAICQNTIVQLDANGDGAIPITDGIPAIDNNSSDACGISALVLNQTQFDCSNVGANTVTLIVTDVNGNASTCTATVTVVDNIAPTASCQDVVVQLDANGDGAASAQLIDNNSSDACGIANLALSQTYFDCDDIGANTVTLTATDENGNASTCMATATVEDNIQPVAICQDLAVQLDANGSAVISTQMIDHGSSDACGVMNQSLSQTSFDCDDIGANTVTLTVTDTYANGATCTAIVTVSDNIAPTAICQDITANIPNSGKINISPQMVDNGSSDACNISMVLNQTFFFCVDQGDNIVTLTVTDASGNASTCTSTVTIVDNTPPSAFCEDNTIQLDIDGNASITAVAVGDDSYDVCDDYPTLMLSQTEFDCSDVGLNTVTLTVTDLNNNTATCTATITVEDITTPQSNCQDMTISLGPDGIYTMNNDELDMNSSDACGIASFLLSKSSYDCADIGIHTVIQTVTDVNGNVSTCTANVTVNDHNTLFPECQDRTVQLDVNGQASITETDIDNGSLEGCIGAPSMSLDVYDFDCNDVGTNTVTLTISGVAGTANCIATVTVQEVTAPQSNCQDMTIYLGPDGTYTMNNDELDMNSSDACGIASYNLSQNEFDCSHVGLVSVIQTVTDVNGLSDKCTAMVTVIDQQVPTALCQDISIYLDEEGKANISVNNIDAGSSDACGIMNASINNDFFDCSNGGANPVTLSLTDMNGNTSSCSATVTVIDDRVPTALCQNVTIQLDNSGSASVTAATVNNGSHDNCSNDIANLALSQTTFDCSELGTNEEVLTATDVNGNSSTCNTIITVEDPIAPDVQCKDVSLYLNDIGEVSTTPSKINNNSSDNCELTDILLSQTIFNCSNLGANMVTLTATDQSGNSSTCTSTVTIIDNIAPTVYCLTTQVEIQTNGTYTLTEEDVYNAYSSHDNCSIADVYFPANTFVCHDDGHTEEVEVTVTDQSGNSSICRAYVSIVLGDDLPDGWNSYDIGSNPLNNNYTFDPCFADNASNGTFSITGSGQNATSHNEDHIAFVVQSLCGDVSITAKIESVSYGGYGGLMIRESSDANAKQVSIFSNLSNILRHEVRYTTNGSKQVNSFYKPASYWLRLERQGDWIFAYYSTDGTFFQYVHGVFVPMQSCVEIGMAAFSYLPNHSAEAVFSHVSVSGSNSSFNEGGDTPKTKPSSTALNLSLYPNPNTGHFTLQLEEAFEEDTRLEIYNLFGQKIAEQMLPAQSLVAEWNIEGTPAGTYWIRLDSVGQKQLVKQFVITD